jgi:putative hemolysin
MRQGALLQSLFNPEIRQDTRRRLHVSLAATPDDLRAAQRLRWQVFVEEMGARVDCDEHGIEADRFDAHCQHLIVRDLDGGHVVGCYRILPDYAALRAGGWYSQSEFDLTRILALPGRIMEVGRTCVHPDYRSGSTIALLWSGLARYLVMNKFDYLMGCASIPLRHGTHEALAVYKHLSESHLSPPEWRVYPRTPLPRVDLVGAGETAPVIPPLVNSYLRVGARICGEPAWDPAFNVADLFIMLRADSINERYARHFVGDRTKPRAALQGSSDSGFNRP